MRYAFEYEIPIANAASLMVRLGRRDMSSPCQAREALTGFLAWRVPVRCGHTGDWIWTQIGRGWMGLFGHAQLYRRFARAQTGEGQGALEGFVGFNLAKTSELGPRAWQCLTGVDFSVDTG